MDLSAFDDFPTAAAAVVDFLQERLGLDLWMVTRTSGDDWIVLGASDRSYGVGAGDVFRWSDSFCSRMVIGAGPMIAPRSNEVPAYTEAPIGRQVPIRAYVGVPLARSDGELFGTLCAIDPREQGAGLLDEQAMVEMMARLLSTVLERDLEAADGQREAERLANLAMRDALTGLPNRRAWEASLTSEEQRCRRFGHPAAVLSVDLDNLKVTNDTWGHAAGDDLLRRASAALQGTVRPHDTLARIGGDEFAYLATECGADGLAPLATRLHDALTEAGVAASVGGAIRQPGSGRLQTAWEEADAAMYEAKAARKRAAQAVLRPTRTAAAAG